MKEKIQAFIEKAKRSLRAAEGLAATGDFDFAASRAYYAMFYMTEALLLIKGHSFSKHSAVIAGFSQHFVKPGIFEPKYADMLRYAFSKRTEGDYKIFSTVLKGEAEKIINDTKEFLEETGKYLSNWS